MATDRIPEITTVLSIGGHELDAQALTSLVGVEPTKVWHQQHEWIKSTHPYINTISWKYELKRQKWNLGDAIDEMLTVFWDKKEELKLFICEHNLRMHIRCRPSGDASALEYIIGPDVLTKIAFFKAGLSLAVYKNEIYSAQDLQ